MGSAAVVGGRGCWCHNSEYVHVGVLVEDGCASLDIMNLNPLLNRSVTNLELQPSGLRIGAHKQVFPPSINSPGRHAILRLNDSKASLEQRSEHSRSKIFTGILFVVVDVFVGVHWALCRDSANVSERLGQVLHNTHKFPTVYKSSHKTSRLGGQSCKTD